MEVHQFVQGQTLSLASEPAATLSCLGPSAGLMECPINKFLNPQTQNCEGLRYGFSRPQDLAAYACRGRSFLPGLLAAQPLCLEHASYQSQVLGSPF